MINIEKMEHKINCEFNDLELLEMVSHIIVKLIKLNQLHNFVNMRYPLFISQKSADANSPTRVIFESLQSTNTARILAKIIYQDIIKAGFGCEGIIYIVSEIISELNNDLKNSSSISKLQV